MKKIILLKLGGSLITDKTKPFTLIKKNIDRIAVEIRQAYEEDPAISMVVGTGTGSFGHYPAEKFEIQNGLKTDIHRYGFCSVHHTAQELNQIVVHELIEKKLKAFSLHPSSMMMAKNGKTTHFFYEPIIRLLEIGMVPVIHGDVVFDQKRGSTIYSVEDVFRELIIRLHVLKQYRFMIIHAGATDGMLDKKNEVIPLITTNNISTIRSSFFDTKGYDVTGGMKAKVLECLDMVQYGIKSLIINGTSKDAIKNSLLEKKVKGTIIQ